VSFSRFALVTVLGLTAALEAAEHQGLGAVRQRGYLRVCADPSNLPFSSSDAATPGFEVELARLVARELGVEARFEWNPTYVRALRPLREVAREKGVDEAVLDQALDYRAMARPHE
jgi:ABC-type amino acid transport substrate-binding protein